MATPTTPGRRVSRLARTGAGVVLAAVSLAGCFTGQRPTLAEAPARTGDQAVDAVLQRLDRVGDSVFTAEYDVLTRFGGVETPATVVQASPTRRSTTIGDVRYTVDGPTASSCDLESGDCRDTIDPALVSDVQLTPDFYGSSPAARLRRDAGMVAGPTVASKAEIAGRRATCVALPLDGGTATYCALDSGVLARLDGADLLIDLTEYSTDADESVFDAG